MVGPPGGLVSAIVPSWAPVRRRIPTRPDPPVSFAPPRPSRGRSRAAGHRAGRELFAGHPHHATAWMRRILEDVWGLDLDVVTREFTLVGVNPALDDLTDVADRIRIDAENRARQAGRTLA
ncbi:MAG: hypothetical protein ACYCTH_07410 [Cellulomonas sp.]